MSTSVPGNSCKSKITTGCIVKLPGECVYYSGSNLTGPGVYTGDNLNIVVNKLNNYIQTGLGTVTSVGLSMPSAFSVSGSPITSSGTFAVTGAGTTAQYVRGDGSLATFPSETVMGANNGLTLTGTNIQLGQTLSQSGNPAILLSDREIPLSSFSVRFTGTGYIQSNALKITGQNTAGDGFPAGVTLYGRTATVSNAQYSYGLQEYSFVTANTGFYGYLGVQSWPYVTGGAGSSLHGKFAGYVSAFSAGPIWDGSLGGTFQLPNMINYFSATQTQAGGILNDYDFYASEINTVGGTTQNPAVTNHYALYADPFTYATNNYGVYINGVQRNYFGGNVGIGINAPTSKLHISDSLTGSSAISTVNIATTWNTTGNPTAIFANIVNTASGATSKLLDIQQDGTSRFIVDKNSGLTEVLNTGLRVTAVGGAAGGIIFGNSSIPGPNNLVGTTFITFSITGSPSLNTYSFNTPVGFGSPTTGSYAELLVNNTSGGAGTGFNPSSGTANLSLFKLTPEINQTGTATGMVRSIHIDHTNFVSAINYRAIDIDVNSNFAIYQSGANTVNYFNGKIGVGNSTVDTSAKVQIDSTTLGFLPPRMTTAEKNAIASPAAGLIVYDTTLGKLCVYTTAWETINSA